MNKLLITLLTSLSFVSVSCSNDDEPKMPTNAITLNMTVGNKGTTIGGSDVYVNSSYNFTTRECGIADFGKKGSFNKSLNLSQIAQEVAVTPGNFYQIVLGRSIKTVAGDRAIPIDSNYYNAYVDSWIYDKDKNIEGVKISYVECHPDTKQLPKWDEKINVKLQMKNGEYTETAVYSFSKGCKVEYVESHDLEHSDMRDRLEIEINENSVYFSNSSYSPGGMVEVIVLVRYDSYYTRVRLIVESSI